MSSLERHTWRVNTYPVGDQVLVQIGTEGTYCPDDNVYVSHPSIWERLRGITFEEKVKQAKIRAEIICGKRNALEERARIASHA